MFGETQNAGVENRQIPAAPNYALTNPAAPPEFGVRSAMSELIQEVKQAAGQSLELRSVLGISVPEQPGPKPGDESLVATISILCGILHGTNTNLSDSIRHIRA